MTPPASLSPAEAILAVGLLLVALVGGLFLIGAFFTPPELPRNHRIKPQPKQQRVLPRNVRR